MPKSIQLEAELHKHFQYTNFRTGQKEIITDVLDGHDVLGILPTGSGKSICYQLPALLLDGLTVVVSPLISLMIDQVKELKAKHFKRVVALNSFINYEERQYIYNHLHEYKLLYISPELLQQEHLMEKLSRQKVSLFVIDEAHCISQWGHDFRPDYLKLGTSIDQLNNPPVLALSATAAPAVQDDIIRNLNRSTMKKRIYPMDRPNLTFVVEKVSSDHEKLEWLTTYLGKNYGPALIYFTSRIQTENMARILSDKLPHLNIGFYHGAMEPMDRIQIQQQFMNDQMDVICCTSAFGMGINKQNIRLIIHYHIPAQMESYIQEVGRAGRDGKTSICLLFFGSYDVMIPKNIIENELPQPGEIKVILEKLKMMSSQGVELPSRELTNDMLEHFQINEIKWRFLRFHFEKHGMILGKKIIYHPEKWQDVYQQLVDWIKARGIHKKQELQEMIDWIETGNCLREQLYKKFQNGFEEPIFQCCSNCGINLSEWKPASSPDRVFEDVEMDWRGKLRQLLVGAENEAK